MAKLEIARQHIFAYTSKKYGVLSYYLILGTSTYGCIHCKIKNTSKFENIIGLKIDNIGYVCINNIQHTPWSKFNFKATTPYRKLTDQEYSLIVNAISNYMLGNIGFANDNTMLYTDQIAVFNANLNKTDEESFESTIDGDSLDGNDDADETNQEDLNTEEKKTGDLPETVEVNERPDTTEKDNKEEISDINNSDEKTEVVSCAVEITPQPKIISKKEEVKPTKPNITDFIPKENIEIPDEEKVGGG